MNENHKQSMRNMHKVDEETSKESKDCGIAVMINDELKKKLLSLHQDELYSYVVLNDEITTKLDDCMELEEYWHDFILLFSQISGKAHMEGALLYDNFDENGSVVYLQDLKSLKNLMNTLKEVDEQKLYDHYQLCDTVFEFQDDWKFLCKLRCYYGKAVEKKMNMLLLYQK